MHAAVTLKNLEEVHANYALFQYTMKYRKYDEACLQYTVKSASSVNSRENCHQKERKSEQVQQAAACVAKAKDELSRQAVLPCVINGNRSLCSKPAMVLCVSIPEIKVPKENTVSERTESGRPEISIIVPVYQVEKYLNECIDSILAQTFTDFELILVDDGSPDNCPALCDAAAKRDSRVRVIHKQNGGVSTARNAGLDAAQGNWIAFVDSDDTAAPEYLEKMHKAVLETGADFAICSSQCIDETGKTLAGGEHRLLNEFLPQEEVLRRMVVSDFQVPWNKLYRRKLLENLRYPENKAFEDTCLMPVIYARAASACGVWDFLYNYRIVTGSAMHRKTTLKTLDWVEAWYRLFDVLYQNGIRDALCAAYRPILTAVWDIWLHLTPEERKSPRMKEAFAYERTARHRLMQARGVTLKNLWAAVVCAASACSYLDLCRKRAERRQKTT